LLIAASIGAGLAGGAFTGRRSAAPQPAPADLAEGPGAANVSGPTTLDKNPVAAVLPEVAEPARPVAPVPPAPPAISARELFRLYQESLAQADERYRGRVVRVRGQVTPAPGDEGICVAGLVTFEPEELPPAAYPEPVRSLVGVLLRAGPSRRADFQALDSGAAVEVEGRCAGWRPGPTAHLGGVVVLEDCRLVPRQKN
jgi:hypothetical protein